MDKKLIRVIVLLLFLSRVVSAFSQPATPEPLYKKFPSYPPVRLLLPDSVSFFTKKDISKKDAVVLMLFNPGCDHCQHETENIISNIEKFKNILVVMATSMPFDSMLAFREKYKLANYKNIVVAQDIHYYLFSFYKNQSLPFLAFYNRKKELISVFEGTLPITAMLEVFK